MMVVSVMIVVMMRIVFSLRMIGNQSFFKKNYQRDYDSPLSTELSQSPQSSKSSLWECDVNLDK